MSAQLWSWAQVQWGWTLCSARCGRLAEALYEGQPYCLDDVERLLERQLLLAAYPEIASYLAPVFRADQE